MNESSFGAEWIFAFLIIAVIFGWGGAGANGGGANAVQAGYATTAEVQNALNNAMASQNAQNILLSSAGNNYETARLIDNQTMSMMNQQNSNLLAAINGFNAVNQNIQSGFSNLSQSIAALGYKMEDCCCSVKTMMLENRLQDTQIALQNQQNIAVNQEQSQYLLSQLGSWTPKAAGGTT